jgi:Ca2+-binding RTX toxin-like protein
MQALPFDGLTPTNYIWVSPTGSDAGTGSKDRPLKTIQAAVDKATAGTAIMVKEGVYNENVKLPNEALGTPDSPIWLISVDGPQAAKVVAADQTVSTIYGYGTDNYVVQGFEIEGGLRGIQFSQEGRDFTNLVSNVLVKDNVIHDTTEDGIKIGQADNAYAIGNTVYNVAGEGIDFLAVNNGFISYNEVYNAESTAAAIFAKGGSTGVSIDHNYVHDIPFGDGIGLGGQTGTEFFRPGFTTYEAKDVIVSDNHVEDVARRPVNVKGAIDSQVIDNYLVGNPEYYAAIAIQMGWEDAATLMYSANIEVAGNILIGNQKVRIHDGNNNAISIHDNAATGLLSVLAGPDAIPSLTGTSSAEALDGTDGSDTIDGIGGADKLYGLAGSDIIDGGNGSDYLYGGLGVDVLTGDAGNDVFVFNSALSGGIDRVTDFVHGSDTFRLENSVFTALGAAGDLPSWTFYSGSAAHDATDRIIYNPATGALTYDADGTGSVAPVQFGTLVPGLTVTASDFLIW